MLRAAAITAGLVCSVLFIVIGLRYEFQLYGDGSLFSYSVAVQDSWAFHWHNISGRVAVYLLCLAPAEAYVALTGDSKGGVVVYGLLFFSAPLLGLIATYFADRSKGRIIFVYACFSTAALCPLVFGFPTEVWVAHALSWPALALCHYASRGFGGFVLVFAVLLALVFTHEGAIIFAVSIVVTLLVRRQRDAVFFRAAGAFVAVIAIWLVVKKMVPPDNYFAGVFDRAAMHFFDIAILNSGLALLLLVAFASYGILFLVFSRFAPVRAQFYAGTIVALALAAYWIWLDRSLHAANRYYMRTILVVATPALGVLAALFALRADNRLNLLAPGLSDLISSLASSAVTRAVTGAFMLLVLVHVVETAKFEMAWSKYKGAVVSLATGTATDPELGDPHFVSSQRIGDDLNRLSWNSTTPYLSVLLAQFEPSRLVVDPSGNYYWLSCRTATANLNANRFVSAESRRLLLVYACLHR